MSEPDNTRDRDGRRIAKTATYSGLRKIIGARMMNSLAKAPQAMISTKMDMSQLLDLKKRLADRGRRATVTDLLIRVVGIALSIHPEVNVAVVEGKIYQYASINIGVAVSTEQGLYVPVIKEVQDKSLLEISAQLKEIVQNLKNGNIIPSDLVGGTFTISNLGMYDIETATPIINAPEAAILCVGASKRQVVVVDDEIVVRPMATFSLTIDHAALDGAPAAQFLATIAAIMNAVDNYVDDDGNPKGGT